MPIPIPTISLVRRRSAPLALAAFAVALACAPPPLAAQTRTPTTQQPAPPPPPPPTQDRPTQERPTQEGTTGQTQGGETAEPPRRGGGFRIPIRPATVPDVRGMSLTAARLLLVRSTLRPGRIDSVATADARPGTIVAQGPAPGTTVVPGYAVRLTIAKAAETVTVPDLSGATAAEARARLAEVRLALGAVDSAESERAEGTVVGQRPAAGTTASPGASVAVSIASARLVAVPELSGQPLARASAALRDAGLRVGGVDSVAAGGEPSSVVRQTVAAGTRVRAGTPVGLVVVRGVATVTVPELAGRTVEEAAALLRRARLARGAVDSAASERAEGRIVRQSPAAGTQARPGTAVTLTVAQARLVAVPNVVGGSAARAAQLLSAAGLRAGRVDSVTAEGPAVTVVRQSVAAGTRVRPGTSLDIVVSRPAQVAVAPPAGPDGASPAPGPAGPVVVVPDLTGRTAADARGVLSAAGLASSVDPALADSATWTVAAQAPVAGTSAAAGTTVQLTLAAPPTPVGPAGEATTPATEPVDPSVQPEPRPVEEEGEIPWIAILIAILGVIAAGVLIRMMRKPPADPVPAPAPEPVAAPPPPPVPIFRTQGAWDPGASEVAVRGRLLDGVEVTLGGVGDAGTQAVEIEGALITAEEGA